MKTVLFWFITQRVVVISYRRFGTTYGYSLPGSRMGTFKGKEWDETADTTR